MSSKVVIPLQTRSFYNYEIGSLTKQSCKLSYPSKRGASTTFRATSRSMTGQVVIPLQTRSFYNIATATVCGTLKLSCHTPPNEELLQQTPFPYGIDFLCCHTPPNEELLQLGTYENVDVTEKLSYPSKRGASTTKRTPVSPTPVWLSYPSKRGASTTTSASSKKQKS